MSRDKYEGYRHAIDRTALKQEIETQALKPLTPKPDAQIGGTHYSRLGVEPIQFIESNQLGYHEGNVVKYISRWRNKNGLEDLNKAKWYIERLIAIVENEKRAPQETTPGQG